MANVFTLFGELRADSTHFVRGLRDAEGSLEKFNKGFEQSAKQREKYAQQSSLTQQRLEAQLAQLKERLATQTSQMQMRLAQQTNTFKERLTQQSAQFEARILQSSQKLFQSTELAKQRIAAQTQIARERMAQQASQAEARAAERAATRFEAEQRRMASAAEKASRDAQKSWERFPEKLQAVGQGIRNIGATLTATLTTTFTTLGSAAIKSAASIDALRNKLTAATGSVAAANAKLKELRDLANSSAGVFSATAADLFAFFKPMKVGEQNINNLIRAFGRLQLADEQFEGKEFGRNLTQLFTQGFEMQDLKQAVGRMPRFGELIAKQFGLKDGGLDTIKESLNGMKASGKLTLESFLAGFAEAVNNDQTLGLLTDTVGTRFQKAMERIMVALEPLGSAILKIIEPIIPPLVAFIEKISSGFQSLSPTIQAVIVGIGAVAVAIGPALIAFGALVGAIASIVVAAKGIAIVGAVLAALAVVAGEVALVAAVVYKAWETNFGGLRDYVAQASQQIQQVWEYLSAAVISTTREMVSEVKAFWEQNGNDIKAALSKVEAFVRRSLATLAQFWTENGDTIKEIVASTWDIVKTVVTTGVRAVMNAIKLITAIINGDWSKAWDALKEIVVGAMEGSVRILTNGLKLIGNLFVLTLKSIYTTLSSAVSEIYGIGANIMQGLWDGMKSKVPSILSFVASTSSTILGAFKSPFVIQSPSRKMMEVGDNIMEGLNLGLVGKKEKVVNTVKVISAAVQKEFQEMQKQLNEVTSGNQATTQGYGQSINLRIQLADADKVKSELAEILALRIELGANLNMPLFAGTGELQILQTIKSDMDALLDTVSEFTDKKAGFAEMMALFDNPNATKLINERAAALKLTAEQLKELLKIQIATAALESAKKNIDDMPEPPPIGRGDGDGTRQGEWQVDMVDVFGGDVPEMKKRWEDFFATFRIGAGEMLATLPDIKTSIGENLMTSIYGIGDVFANAITQWDGTAKGFFKSLAQGFADMARQIISELIRIAVMRAVLNLVGMFGGAAAGGGSASGGAGGIAGGHGLHGFASGGFTGSGSANAVAGIVHRGEYVMPANVVKRFGLGFMEQVKNLQMPSMPQMAFAGGGGATTHNNQRSNVFNINVQGGGSTEQQRQSAIAVRKEILKGLQKEEMRNR